MTLHYRLTHQTLGSSVTAHLGEPDIERELFDLTLALVGDVWRRMGHPVITENMTPEILSTATLDRIERLEDMVESLRNTLIDLDDEKPGPYSQLITEAGRLLRYPATD